MVIDRVTMSTTLNQIQSLTGEDKNVPGLLLDIHENDIDICFSNGNKTFIKNIAKQNEEDDIKGKIIVNFKAFKTAVDACEPFGVIETKTIQIVNDTEASMKIVAEKIVPIIKDGERVDDKVASVVEQRVGYEPEEKAVNNVKVSILLRERYELLKAFDEEYIEEKYPGVDIDSGLRPLNFTEWEETRDEWDKAELCNVLTKLSAEKSKVMYVSQKSKIGFVQNTATNVSLPIKSNIKHIIALPTNVAKGLADVLNKLNEDVIYTHMIDKFKMSFSTADGKFAVMVTNLMPDKNHLTGFNGVTAKQYTNCIMNFNKDVMLSVFKGAKVATSTDKIELKIVPEKNADGVITDIKAILEITNSGSSTANKYDLIPEMFIVGEDFEEMKVNINLQTMIDAITRTDEAYIGMDIHDSKIKTIRVSGIDIQKMEEVKAKVIEDGAEWDNEARKNYRGSYIGVTTYFSA